VEGTTWHTWSSIFFEIILARPLPFLGIQLPLHDLPRKHNRTIIRIHILGRVPWLLEMLDEMDGEVLKIWQVEAVEPDHGAGAVLAVVVPVPGRREDYVAALHGDALAMDGGEAALAFDYEAHSEGDVAVGAGDFVGHDELEAGIEGVCCEGCIFY
jgi:hypothetical protein